MSDKLYETIQDIAIRHEVVLSKDDPILIFHTMNEKLFEENKKAQEDLLRRFKQEMEHISSQWKDDAKEKAEKILNAALVGSKEAMAKLLKESTSELVCLMRKIISDALAETQDKFQKAQKYCRFTLLSTATILMVFCFLLFIVHVIMY